MSSFATRRFARDQARMDREFGSVVTWQGQDYRATVDVHEGSTPSLIASGSSSNASDPDTYEISLTPSDFPAYDAGDRPAVLQQITYQETDYTIIRAVSLLFGDTPFALRLTVYRSAAALDSANGGQDEQVNALLADDQVGALLGS